MTRASSRNSFLNKVHYYPDRPPHEQIPQQGDFCLSRHHLIQVIFWGLPLFLAVFGHSHFRGATTLNFGPISTKLGGIVRVIKKMTQKDNGPGPGRNYGETGVFTFGRKVVFGLKMGLTPKNHPK